MKYRLDATLNGKARTIGWSRTKAIAKRRAKIAAIAQGRSIDISWCDPDSGVYLQGTYESSGTYFPV